MAEVGSAARGKPTRALPTERTGFEKQTEILQAYGALGATDGVTGIAVAEVVGVHHSSVSPCNPFFAESGLIEKAGIGYKASAALIAYHRAISWDGDTAFQKLAPTFRQTWYWNLLASRLSFRPLEESEAIRILADGCDAGPPYRSQIKLILDFLERSGLVVRDGGMVKRGPTAEESAEDSTRKEPVKSVQQDPPSRSIPEAKKAPETVLPGIAFDASIRITEKEIGSWSPDQIREFFTGLAAVISAKSKAGESQ